MTRAPYRSFGGTVPPGRAGIPAAEAIALLGRGEARPASLAAYGKGRSYGDSGLNAAGTAIDMRGMDRILSFDPRSGILEAEAGAPLSAIIDHAAPYGWFPAVLPGTRHVTLGGAIANDIHGKNHHRRGTFGAHVESLSLLRSDGLTRDCSPRRNREYFRATIGGLGLTGLILSARVRLMRVAALDVVEQVTPFGSLGEYLDLAEAVDQANEYAVAWVDQLSGGEWRGLLISANHAEAPMRAGRWKPRPTVPFQPPFNLLSRPFLRLFNGAYFHARARRPGPRLAGHKGFFFPLDGIGNWNRLYGPRGLHQHQSVIPFVAAREAIPLLLEAGRRAGHASFLTVLKRFGDSASPGTVSFPRPGYTLTLDFPNRGATTLRLLDELDRITLDAGGAVNAYKDARMAPETFARSYPRWREVEAMRDPAFMTDFWRRTAMRAAGDDHRLAAE